MNQNGRHNENFQNKYTHINDDYSNVLNFMPQSPGYTYNSVKSKVDTYNQTQGTFLSKDEDLEMNP